MGLGNLFRAVVKIAVTPITVPIALATDVMDSMTDNKGGHTKDVIDSITDDLNDVTK